MRDNVRLTGFPFVASVVAQWRRVHMQRDERIGLVLIDDDVGVGVVGAAHAACLQMMSLALLHRAITDLEDDLRGCSLHHSNTTCTAAMVVDRAGLSGLPAEDERLITGAFPEQVALVLLIAETNVRGDVIRIEIHGLQPLHQLANRDGAGVGIESVQQFIKLHDPSITRTTGVSATGPIPGFAAVWPCGIEGRRRPIPTVDDWRRAMRGNMMIEFCEFAGGRFGASAISDACAASDVASKCEWTHDGDYDARELREVVSLVARRVGIPTSDLLSDFAAYVFNLRIAGEKGDLSMASDAFEAIDRYAPRLEEMCGHAPTRINVVRSGASSVEVSYCSDSAMSEFVAGLINACFVHFGSGCSIVAADRGGDGTHVVFNVTKPRFRAA